MAPRGGQSRTAPGEGLGEAGRTGLSGAGERMEGGRGARTFLGPGWLSRSGADCERLGVEGVKGERGAWPVGTALRLSPGKVVIPLPLFSETSAIFFVFLALMLFLS